MEQLAAFAAAYVRFAEQEPALFDITLHAGLDKSRFPELDAAGGGALADTEQKAARTARAIARQDTA